MDSVQIQLALYRRTAINPRHFVFIPNDNFENPLEFCAERFLKDGAFRNDPRVCIFSLGLRDCIAKKFAKE